MYEKDLDQTIILEKGKIAISEEIECKRKREEQKTQRKFKSTTEHKDKKEDQDIEKSKTETGINEICYQDYYFFVIVSYP